ncbi:mandelate racemase/muconate lactonizing enzyme family protein [Pseudohoeflea coraliihabitans]|uniref:Mandelate racemase/muconate lactonizing enzyme family protein n=1 Tax=Pseudohoeflea coraliihabitans TaxID=2860393 RepID=A0ABS6WIB1_9HYPH|nr:mandelate racemase/muconate lactonizing enzyme family protein [Pseudohoeflea sp. DP4N28-3]MBW3095692.1 mandelate racemase/muconate lactonizing enzyme family protein [Pseudohoeflea sp. DP4N28-3]
MKIESVELFYLAMPEITEEVDGSQDALLVRVSAGGLVGWGECEAAPLPSIAAFVCPPSHGVCRPVGASVLGARLDSVADIARISAEVRYNSMDLLQSAHTLSGIEMALWDLLGRKHDAPVWSLLGFPASLAKTPYASLLFGETPEITRGRAEQARGEGFHAAKFGWGPIGRHGVAADAAQFEAARQGLGADAHLMVDAGQIFGTDVGAAADRLEALDAADVLWLEEPFDAGAFEAYAALAEHRSRVRLAGGEAAHNVHMAQHLLDYGRIGFVQVDCGRIGGIGPARQVAEMAAARKVTYVNHTFTSHLALSASLQPFAGMDCSRICEYPASPKPLAAAIAAVPIGLDADGCVRAPEAPGLGIDINVEAIRPYLVDTEIRVSGEVIYRTPDL